MKDTDHGAQKGILKSRSQVDQVEAFLGEVDTFDVVAVHRAFVEARQLSRKLADALFEADVALQLRSKDGPPAGPLFEGQAAEQGPKSRSALEEKVNAFMGGEPEPPSGALFDSPASDVPGEAEPISEQRGDGGLVYRRMTYGGGAERAVLRIEAGACTGVALLTDEPWPAEPAGLEFDTDEQVVAAYSKGGEQQGGAEPEAEPEKKRRGRKGGAA